MQSHRKQGAIFKESGNPGKEIPGLRQVRAGAAGRFFREITKQSTRRNLKTIRNSLLGAGGYAVSAGIKYEAQAIHIRPAEI